jgi:hypothetical protein
MKLRLPQRRIWLLPGLVLAALTALSPGAQAVIEKPTRITNDSYHFAFTVETNCEVTYQKGGVGFSASHLPAGSNPDDKGVKADYGLLVYGAPLMHLSKAEAQKAKFPPFEEKTFAPDELPDGVDVADVISAVMSLNKREAAGEATIEVEGGKAVKVPYFMWTQKVAGQSRHAFMYVVPHDNSFIYVQAESRKPFTPQAVSWFTTKLELLKVPAGPAG